jgi:acetyltransferase-like isoleucine patch superfamily enzyme
MDPVRIPVTDVNSETAVIAAWHVADGTRVHRGELIAEAETSKAVIEVESPSDGVLLREVAEGAEVRIDAVIGQVFERVEQLDDYRRSQQEQQEALASVPEDRPRATRSAIELAQRHGIDLSTLPGGGLLTSRDVEAALADSQRLSLADLPQPLRVDEGRRRVLLLGAGLGATQVLDILGHDPEQVAVALVDDESVRWGDEVEGVPVVGGRARIRELVEQGWVDAAIITISTSIAARTLLREACEEHGLTLTNAIDPTARIASGVQMGVGNVVAAFCHLGVGAVVGDNNFLSAYNSFDHHSTLGSDISTGPGCMTSGLVTLGDRVRMGTGIFVEPKVRIGDDAIVASGSVVVSSVPDGHVVKARAGSTVVSPRRV